MLVVRFRVEGFKVFGHSETQVFSVSCVLSKCFSGAQVNPKP